MRRVITVSLLACGVMGCHKPKLVIAPAAVAPEVSMQAAMQGGAVLPDPPVCPRGWTEMGRLKRDSDESTHPGVVFVRSGDVWLVCVDKSQAGSTRALAAMLPRDSAPPDAQDAPKK